MSTISQPSAASNPPGRPRSLDDAKRREIVALVSAGCGIQDAARYVHCAPSTIHKERKHNKEFRDELRRAQLVAQLHPLRAMQHAVGTHWRAAAWMLERTHPDRFARQNPLAFGPKQARALMDDLLAIVREEVFDSAISDRLQKRITAAMRYAMRASWDMRRASRDLRRAMEFFAQKGPSINPLGLPGFDFVFPHAPPVPTAPSTLTRPKAQPPASAQSAPPPPTPTSPKRNADAAAFRRLSKSLADALGPNFAAGQRPSNSASDTVT
jgi:hypothetical protein